MLKNPSQQAIFDKFQSFGESVLDPLNERWMDTWTDRQPVKAQPENEARVQAVVDGLATASSMRVRWHLTELGLIVEAVRNNVHGIYGFESIEDYLCFQLGEGYNKTCEKVNVALMLEELVAMREAYGKGQISWDHLRALVKVATCENEEELLQLASKSTVAKTNKIVNKIAALDAEDSAETRSQRYLEMRVDKARRTVSFWGELPEEQGQVLKKAIDQIAKELPDDANADDEPTPMASKRADALYELAASALSERGPGSAVLVHVDAAALSSNGSSGSSGSSESKDSSGIDSTETDAESSGSSESSDSSETSFFGTPVGSFEDGTALPPGVAERLLCDSSVQLVIDDDQGAPLGYGRRRRTVNQRLRHGLMNRDQGCGWHGCRRIHNLQAHHLVSWIDGGRTDYDNLLLLCHYHHRAVHEGGFRLRGSPGNIQIFMPNGKLMELGPPSQNEKIRQAFGKELQLVGGPRPYGGDPPPRLEPD